MIRKSFAPTPRRHDDHVIANHRIRFPEVRVLDEHGEFVGVMPSRDAQFRAQEAGKDLVLVTEKAQPPVVKIIDLAKFKYQQQQKEAEGRKKSRKQDIKGVRFSPFMGDNDFESRLKKTIGFLEKGDKVRLMLQFKGRAITKKEFGFDIITRVIEATAEISQVEIAPKLMGKQLMAQLTPVKKVK
jgi:translation initiation factor IF-3